MYVRGAKKREEVWLLDRLEELGLSDPAFRSRDYVVALDEESGEKAGFGRLRVHSAGGEDVACEVVTVGTLPRWRRQGVGAHVLERLVEQAGDRGFERVYALTSEAGYCAQFGFGRVDEGGLLDPLSTRLEDVREDDPDALPVACAVADFGMPDRLRERFKDAESEGDPAGEPERPEDFGIDPESATYKYDTGR
ncbi:MAG: GNAT family N-acetyltransferase [Halobacteriaceae archaeon]